MAESPRLTFRLPSKLRRALERKAKASDMDLATYVRHLCEADTGVDAHIERGGFDKMTPKRLRAVASKGSKNRWAVKKAAEGEQ